MNEFTILPGSASHGLAAAAAHALEAPLGECAISRFPDGEIYVRVDETIRGRNVFLVQSMSPPINDHLMELLLMADACRRAGANRIGAIIPYLGYSRADKRHGHREAISASMVAGLLENVGIDQIVTVDLHSPQIEGFFRIPVDTLSAVSVLCGTLRDVLPPDTVVVAPDTGRMKLALEYGRRLEAPVVVLHEQRDLEKGLDILQLVGDVRNRPCLIVDDMIVTGGTMAESIEALLAAGAKPEIFVASTHAVFLPATRKNLGDVSVQKIFVTDTVPVRTNGWPQLRVVSIAPLIATAIQSMATNRSMGAR